MPVYRAALVGTGAIAEAHIKAVHALENRVRFVAAMDADAERVRAFSARHEIPNVYTDLDALLREQTPDLVINCAPPYVHAAQSIAALEAGAWVLCEKPLCASLAEFDRISDAENRTGRYLSTVFQWRFGSAGQHFKRMIDAGVLGAARVLTCHALWYRDLAYHSVAWRGKWETEIGGTTMAHGIHLFDLLLWLVGGGWSEVQAQIATLDRPMQTDNLSMAIAHFDNGALASLISSALSPRQNSHLRIDFQRGTLEVEGLYGYTNADWRFTPLDPNDDFSAWLPIPDDYPSDHTAQLSQFLNSMDAGTRPPVSGDEGRRILEFTSSLYKSAFTRQIIARGSITPGDPFYQSISGQVTPR